MRISLLFYFIIFYSTKLYCQSDTIVNIDEIIYKYDSFAKLSGIHSVVYSAKYSNCFLIYREGPIKPMYQIFNNQFIFIDTISNVLANLNTVHNERYTINFANTIDICKVEINFMPKLVSDYIKLLIKLNKLDLKIVRNKFLIFELVESNSNYNRYSIELKNELNYIFIDDSKINLNSMQKKKMNSIKSKMNIYSRLNFNSFYGGLNYFYLTKAQVEELIDLFKVNKLSFVIKKRKIEGDHLIGSVTKD